LGAGGTVGLCYHAGVLRALEEVGGFAANDADLIVGTSAGSVVGAYLRVGWTTEDLWKMAMGTHPILAGLDQAEIDARRANLFTPNFRSMPELVRRGLGSAFVVARSVWRLPAPVAPAVLRNVFPGGLFDMTEGARRFTEDLPQGWPDRPLWLCAVDIVSGRRIVLGRPGSPLTSLHTAVTASCAVPGFYQPVRVGNMTLVDGGVRSTTNLELAARDNCDLIIGVVPMAWDTSAAPCAIEQLPRRYAARKLATEMLEAKARGSQVLLLRPTAAETRLHGLNMMRRQGWEEIASAAYDNAARILDTPRFRNALGALAA